MQGLNLNGKSELDDMNIVQGGQSENQDACSAIAGQLLLSLSNKALL